MVKWALANRIAIAGVDPIPRPTAQSPRYGHPLLEAQQSVPAATGEAHRTIDRIAEEDSPEPESEELETRAWLLGKSDHRHRLVPGGYRANLHGRSGRGLQSELGCLHAS